MQRPATYQTINRPNFKPATIKGKRGPKITPNHVVVLMASITGLGLLFFLLSHQAIANFFYPLQGDKNNIPSSEVDSEYAIRPLDMPIESIIGNSSHSMEDENWNTITVTNGDNLSMIFGRLGLSTIDVQRVFDVGSNVSVLKRLIPGQQLKIKLAGRILDELVYEVDGMHTLHVKRQGETYEANDLKRNVETRLSYTTGLIDSSLFLAAQQIGLSVNLTMQFAAIFGWDVDFALDIRKGDRFTVVFEEIFADGEKMRDGSILAAEFINQNKIYRAVRYIGKDGRADYYNPAGQNLRKAFLRTPVDFSYITSGFGLRLHPVLNRMRAHRGVDYAAPVGTAIRATGDGTVLFKGVRSGGYGKMIVVQHGSGYETVYAHLSQFRNELRNGSAIRQGQIIGYVGMTGLATGPHLHYEFRVNGMHRDPLTIKLPSAAPITNANKSEFLAQTSRWVKLLKTLDKNNIALTN